MDCIKKALDGMIVLGAGQLGMAVLRALAPRAHAVQVPITVLVSPRTVDNPSPEDAAVLAELHSLGMTVVGFDLSSDESALAELFSRYTTVLSCSGFVAGPGTQLKITRAALAAGVRRYFPWQFGVDYDVVGRGSGQPVFDEQYEVRQLLRSQDATEWVIISTGMFMSFLFEPAFGVVDLQRRTVRGLGSWDTKVTVTTPEDIGKLTTEVVLAQPRITNEVVYLAGDTISYGQLADTLERVTGQQFQKGLWTLDTLQADLAATPNDVMARYRKAFALGHGMWWDKSRTFNARNGYPAIDVEWYLRTRLG